MPLFSADAGHVWDNPAFRIKTALIALGLVNAAWFRWRFGARHEGWDADPPAARTRRSPCSAGCSPPPPAA